MQEFFQVDAFTAQPFAGNPAAVCLLAEPGDEAWMQRVAAEMNLSETAFLYPEKEGWRLRWFTPAVEVDLCGHATLASAHVLWEELEHPAERLEFYTLSGTLSATRAGAWIELDFPNEAPYAAQAPAGLLDALGVSETTFVGRNRVDWFVALPDAKAVRTLRPDFGRLGTIESRGVIVTGPSDEKPYDFVSRFFAPRAGILEDPVTGSAHCALGPFWQERLDKDVLMGYQASLRGGVVRVRPEATRVRLGGQAVTMMQGVLRF